jgi:hypothetical protein
MGRFREQPVLEFSDRIVVGKYMVMSSLCGSFQKLLVVLYLKGRDRNNYGLWTPKGFKEYRP